MHNSFSRAETQEASTQTIEKVSDVRTQTDLVLAKGAEVHVESTREWTVDDLVVALIEFLSSRRADEQIDDVP